MALIKPQVVLLALAASVVFPAFFACATEFVVGDDSGWRIDFDYEAWAKGKTFHVGDKLVFNYKEGYHTVVKMNGTGFIQCTISPINGIFTSGSDRISLATLGNKWYICGVANHCSHHAQKLKIRVVPQGRHYKPPTPPQAPAMPPSEVPPPAPEWGAPSEVPTVPAPAETQRKNGDGWYSA